MTGVLIDSNVLLDIMTEDARWPLWSPTAVSRAADRSRLVLNPIIYAEVSVRYSRVEDMETALPKAMIEREAIPMRRRFSPANHSWRIVGAAGRNDHRFPISSSAPMRQQPATNY